MGALSGSPRAGPAPDDGEILAALALADVPGLGLARLRSLVDAHGSFHGLLADARRGDAELAGSTGRGRARRGLAAALRRVRPAPPSRLEALRERDLAVAVYGAPGYPDRLAHLPDPPPLLYLRGRTHARDAPLFGRPAVAVVGTRRATEYGRRVARDLSGGLAAAGWVVVSGMARGIDATAHAAALDADGLTVGVLGSGFDHEYPATNRELYRRMRRHGLLVTEFPPQQPPLPHHFPRRNRIIAALGSGVIVVQAGRRSGALNTAGHALDLGREVLAVPGPVGSPASEGVHGLLRDGAALATDVADVWEALHGPGAPHESPAAQVRPGPDRADGATTLQRQLPFGPRETTREPWRGVWRELLRGPQSVDALLAASGVAPGELVARLTRWELAELVEALPGGRYRASGVSTDPRVRPDPR